MLRQIKSKTVNEHKYIVLAHSSKNAVVAVKVFQGNDWKVARVYSSTISKGAELFSKVIKEVA
jgi:hypothetical protein